MRARSRGSTNSCTPAPVANNRETTDHGAESRRAAVALEQSDRPATLELTTPPACEGDSVRAAHSDWAETPDICPNGE